MLNRCNHCPNFASLCRMMAVPASLRSRNCLTVTAVVGHDASGKLILHAASTPGPRSSPKTRALWAQKHMADVEKLMGRQQPSQHALEPTAPVLCAPLLSSSKEDAPTTGRRKGKAHRQGQAVSLGELLKAQAEKTLFALGVPRTTQIYQECTLVAARQRYEVYRDALTEFANAGGACSEVLSDVSAQYDLRVAELKRFVAQHSRTKHELRRKEAALEQIRAHRKRLKAGENANLLRIQEANTQQVSELLRSTTEVEESTKMLKTQIARTSTARTEELIQVTKTTQLLEMKVEACQAPEETWEMSGMTKSEYYVRRLHELEVELEELKRRFEGAVSLEFQKKALAKLDENIDAKGKVIGRVLKRSSQLEALMAQMLKRMPFNADKKTCMASAVEAPPPWSPHQKPVPERLIAQLVERGEPDPGVSAPQSSGQPHSSQSVGEDPTNPYHRTTHAKLEEILVASDEEELVNMLLPDGDNGYGVVGADQRSKTRSKTLDSQPALYRASKLGGNGGLGMAF